jgi:hypothetical protein
MSLQYAIPKVGSKIRVTTKFKNHVLSRADEYILSTYVGTVGSAHKLLSPNSFVLSTPDTPQFPKREINLAKVIHLEYLDGSTAKKVQTVDHTWQVKGSKGDSYTVTRVGNKLNCTCTGFQFRRKCKHLDVAK